MTTKRTLSVVVPTYHRPEFLMRAVRSVLEQAVPEDIDVEVVISLSDKDALADRAAAETLAGDDSRVRFVVAERDGPAVARNTGLAAAKGDLIALLDDDCEAQTGWLAAGVRRLEDVQLVQGHTRPGDNITSPRDKSIWVYGISGLWESCNLFFRRDVLDRFGGFDETWNPTGRPSDHWGEDTEWGWRVVRGGTSYAYEPAARVFHAVFPQTYKQWLKYESKVRYFPLMLHDMPELRDAMFYKRYFLIKRHRTLTVGLLILIAGGVAALLGFRTVGLGLALLSLIPFASAHIRNTLYPLQKEWLHYWSLVYGSIRYRKVVL